ncbi:MAG: MFS transporter [Fuerstiella sp.]|nr:MFS transporter [Fuerstiella sp.]
MSAGISAVQRTLRAYVDLPVPVRLLCLGAFINRAGSFVFVFLTIYVSEQLGFGISYAANCFGVFGLGSIISSLAGGQLADRIGRKPVMVFALFGGAAALVLLGVVRDRWVFLGLIFVFALAIEMYRPAASAMVGDLVNATERPLAFGLMYIAFNLGFAFAAPVGGLLAQFSFKLLFWGDALTTAAYGLIIVFFIKETHPQMTVVTRRETQHHDIGLRDAVRHILHNRIFLLIMLATFLTSLVFMQAFSTLPIHLNQLGYSKRDIGLLLSTNGILIVLCQLPVTHVLNRFERVGVILAGELLLAAGFGLTTFAVTGPMFLVTITVWTMGEVFQAAFKKSLVADLAPAQMRGRYMGVYSLCHAVGLSIGAPLGGRILDRWGSQVLWPTCFAVMIAAAAVYAVVYVKQQSGLLAKGRAGSM